MPAIPSGKLQVHFCLCLELDGESQILEFRRQNSWHYNALQLVTLDLNQSKIPDCFFPFNRHSAFVLLHFQLMQNRSRIELPILSMHAKPSENIFFYLSLFSLHLPPHKLSFHNELKTPWAHVAFKHNWPVFIKWSKTYQWNPLWFEWVIWTWEGHRQSPQISFLWGDSECDFNCSELKYNFVWRMICMHYIHLYRYRALA